MSLPWVAAAAVVLAAGGLVWIYNGLVRRRNRVDATWSDIDVLLRRRHDLVPNLVAAVQGYASHESQTVRGVAEARASAITAQGPRPIGGAGSSPARGGHRLLLAPPADTAGHAGPRRRGPGDPGGRHPARERRPRPARRRAGTPVWPGRGSRYPGRGIPTALVLGSDRGWGRAQPHRL